MPLTGLLALVALGAQDKIQSVPLALVASGITQHAGGYPSIQLPLSTKKPAGLNRPPMGIAAPLYGALQVGGFRFIVVLATFGKATHIFVDSNLDGDLSNDPPAAWHSRAGQANAGGSAKVQLPFHGKRALCNVIFVQTGPKMLTVISDYGYKGRLHLGAREVPFYLIDGAQKGFPGGKPAGSTLGIDRKGNGVISGPAEQYVGELPFTIDGTSLVLRSVDLAQATATFVPGEKVAEIPLPLVLQINEPVPTFTSQTLDGKPINFPADFSGRIVLVYVWASWSQPSLDWLPRVSKVYEAYKNLGFSVFGVSLNRATEGDMVKASVAQMPWTTGYDGKSWSSDVVRALSINTLPFVLLVDGKTGKIIATMDDLVGDRFEAVIRSAVVGGG